LLPHTPRAVLPQNPEPDEIEIIYVMIFKRKNYDFGDATNKQKLHKYVQGNFIVK